MIATAPAHATAEHADPTPGYWFEFRDGRLQPAPEPEWAKVEDWTAARRGQGYSLTQEDIGDIGESFLGLDLYHRGDHDTGHTWLFGFGACCDCFYVEIRGFPAYLEFLRWLAGPLQLAALEKLNYRFEEAVKGRK
jgi:hypothetical protein